MAVALGWAAVLALAAGLARAAGIGLAAGRVAGALGLGWYLVLGTRSAVSPASLAVNLLLAWFFGRTLPRADSARDVVRAAGARRGRARARARALHAAGDLGVGAFFAATIAISFALASFATLAAWSLFANLLAAPPWRRCSPSSTPTGAAARRLRARSVDAILRRLAAAGFSDARPSAK